MEMEGKKGGLFTETETDGSHKRKDKSPTTISTNSATPLIYTFHHLLIERAVEKLLFNFPPFEMVPQLAHHLPRDSFEVRINRLWSYVIEMHLHACLNLA